METFAAYTAQTDHEVGRLLDTLEEIGQLDNTLVIWMIGDNGASMEGGLHGAFNEMVDAERHPGGSRRCCSRSLDEIGGPNAYNHYPVGWAWAMNTPFQWGKQVASPLRRHAQPAGRLLADAHQGHGRPAHAVPPRASTSCRPSWRRPASPSR